MSFPICPRWVWSNLEIEARDCSRAVGGRNPAELLAGSIRESGGVAGGGTEGAWKERESMIVFRQNCQQIIYKVQCVRTLALPPLSWLLSVRRQVSETEESRGSGCRPLDNTCVAMEQKYMYTYKHLCILNLTHGRLEPWGVIIKAGREVRGGGGGAEE